MSVIGHAVDTEPLGTQIVLLKLVKVEQGEYP